MPTSYWTLIAALISVGFGWLLNETGQFFRGLKENRKIKHKVLFYLLEIQYILARQDSGKLLDMVTKELFKRMPAEEQTPDVKTYLTTYFNQLISGLMDTGLAKEIEDIKANYVKAVEELSQVDPLAAFRLKGKTDIPETLEMFSVYIESVKKSFPMEKNELEKYLNTIRQDFKPDLVKSTLEELEKEINHLASSIGFFRGREIKKYLAESKKEDPAEAEARLKKIFDTYIPATTE